MALLVTKENRPVFVTAEQAAALWLVKTGERKGTPTTKKKANSIAKWFLNYANAPRSWKALNPPERDDRYSKREALADQLRLPYRN